MSPAPALAPAPGFGRGAPLALVATALDKLAVLGIALWLPRHLGLADYGHYTLVVALLAFFQSLPDGSIESVLVARLSRDEGAAARLAGAAVPVRAAVSALCGVAGLAALGLASGESGLVVAGAPWALGLWIAAANPYRALLRAELRLGRYLGVIAVQAAATVSALVVVVRSGRGLGGVLATGAIGAAAALVAGRLLAGRGARPHLDALLARGLVRSATPLAATGLVLLGAQQLLAVVLLRTHGADAVGLFGGAQRLVDAVNLLPQAVVVSLLPALARSGHARAALRAAADAARLLALLVAPLVVGLALWPRPALTVLLGAPFAAAAPVLQVLATVALLAASGQVLTALMIASGRERLLFAVTAASAGVTAGLGLALVPPFGPLGSAAAAAGGMAAGQLGLVVLPATREAALHVLGATARPLALGALAGAVASLAAGGDPVRGPLAFAAAYLAAVAGAGGISREQLVRWTR